MERFRFNPYEGTENYIFISYAHANSALVEPIVNRLNLLGYNVWYDRGIEYGDKWIRSIEEHLRKSSVILSFISPQYSQSDWCMREYTYAEKIGKEVIHIKLTEGILEGGLGMMISNRQIINDDTVLSDMGIVREIEKALNSKGIQPKSNTDYNDSFDENSSLNPNESEVDINNRGSLNRNESSEFDLGYPQNAKSANKQNIYSNKNKNDKKKNTKLIIILSICIAAAVCGIVIAAVIIGNNSDNKEENTLPENTVPYVTQENGWNNQDTKTTIPPSESTKEETTESTEETTKSENTEATKEESADKNTTPAIETTSPETEIVEATGNIGGGATIPQNNEDTEPSTEEE